MRDEFYFALLSNVILKVSRTINDLAGASEIKIEHLAEAGGRVGKDGGKLAPLADIELRVPHFDYADRIQEIHIKIIQILILLIEKEVV